MFIHPGRKLKGIAMVIFLLFAVAGVFAGLFVSASIDPGDPSPIEEFLVGMRISSPICGILGGLVGMLVGWINSIVLYAFGALVDDVEEIKESLRK